MVLAVVVVPMPCTASMRADTILAMNLTIGGDHSAEGLVSIAAMHDRMLAFGAMYVDGQVL